MQNTNESDWKTCTRCKQHKPISQYGNTADKKLSACRECINKAQKIQYANNKKYYLDRNRERRAINREWYQEIKNKTPCVKCGNQYPYYVMDYDHIEPTNKILCVAQMMGFSRKAILNEMAKCELLCANCHRIKTYETSNRQQQHRITTANKRPRSKCTNR